MKRILAALCFLVLSVQAHADLTVLDVQFTPDRNVFEKGDIVDVTASGNGTGMQYRFVLERMGLGGGATLHLIATDWSSTPTFQFDTAAVNMPVGKYRLKVRVREGTMKSERLVKAEIFTLVNNEPTACDSIHGKTYTNATAASLNMGTVTDAQLQTTLNLTTGTHAGNITSVYFNGGNASLSIQPMYAQTCKPFIGCHWGYLPQTAPLTGTYACSGNTVTINMSGSVKTSDFLNVSNAPPMQVTVTGGMTIDTGTDSLTAGGKTFE